MLILHDQSKPPRFEPVGRIARVSRFAVIDETTDQSEAKAFLVRAFGGGLWTHVTRFIAYSLLFIVFIFLIVFITDQLDKQRARKRKRDFLEAFLKKLTPAQRAASDPVVAFINKHDIEAFRAAASLLLDREAIRKTYLALQNTQTPKHRFYFPMDVESGHPSFPHVQQYVLGLMIADGLLTVDATGNAHVTPELVDIAKSFLAFAARRRRRLQHGTVAEHNTRNDL